MFVSYNQAKNKSLYRSKIELRIELIPIKLSLVLLSSTHLSF